MAQDWGLPSYYPGLLFTLVELYLETGVQLDPYLRR